MLGRKAMNNDLYTWFDFEDAQKQSDELNKIIRARHLRANIVLKMIRRRVLIKPTESIFEKIKMYSFQIKAWYLPENYKIILQIRNHRDFNFNTGVMIEYNFNKER